mgnify:CR=1 FL=1
MAEYKTIKGFKVESLAADPTANEGQIWYNTTTNLLKYDTVNVGAWASGGNMNTTRSTLAAAGASNSSGVAMGGVSPPPGAILSSAEKYNGTAWTATGAMVNERRYFTGLGTETAAMACGGIRGPSPGEAPTSKTETFDGSTWTEVNDLSRTPSTSPQAQTRMGGFGTTTSGLVMGGDESASQLKLCEQYNGTSWSEVADLLQTQSYGFSSGQTGASGLFMGGYGNPPWAQIATTGEWNDTSWTAGGNMNTARDSGGFSVYGVVTQAMIVAGRVPPPNSVLCELYNGTSWTEVADCSTGRYYCSGSGTGTSALVMGGYAIPSLATTEEWDGAPAVVKTVTVS